MPSGMPETAEMICAVCREEVKRPINIDDAVVGCEHDNLFYAYALVRFHLRCLEKLVQEEREQRKLFKQEKKDFLEGEKEKVRV
jgi:hypothetical protein